MSISFYPAKEQIISTPKGPIQTVASIGELDLNVTNRNAAQIMNLLGFELGDDGAGQIHDVARLEQRCREELAIIRTAPEILDGGSPDECDGNWIECGHGQGYFEDRLSQLRVIAEYALLHDGVVGWS